MIHLYQYTRDFNNFRIFYTKSAKLKTKIEILCLKNRIIKKCFIL